MKRRIKIPVELAKYVLNKGIVPEFKVLIAAKYISPGHFLRKSTKFVQLCEFTGFGERTVVKHLNHLVRLGWLGIESEKQKYYVRSWNWFYEKEIFSTRRTALFCEEDMVNFRAFLAGSVINDKVLKHIHWCEVQKRKLIKSEQRILKYERKRKPRKSVVSNKGCTTFQDQSVPSPSNSFKEPDYYGLSNKGIAELIGSSETYARKLKHEAEEAGYLETNGRFYEYMRIGKPNFGIRNELYRCEEISFVKKLRYNTIRRNGRKIVLLVQQLHDEIIPMTEFSQINYEKRIRQHAQRNRKTIAQSKNIIIPRPDENTIGISQLAEIYF